MAERPLVLPPEIREPMACHCSSNQHPRRALGAAPRRSLPPHSRRASGFSWFDASRAGVPVRTRSIMAPCGSGEPKRWVASVGGLVFFITLAKLVSLVRTVAQC
jgi:hypothetical protein